MKIGTVFKEVECDKCHAPIIIEKPSEITTKFEHVDDDLRSSHTVHSWIKCPGCKEQITIEISYPTCPYFSHQCPDNKEKKKSA